MTKKKKIICIAVSSVLCLLIVAFSVFWFVPYRRHLNFNRDVIQTDEFLPYPDSVVCMVEGKAKWLEEEQIKALHQALVDLMPQATESEGIATPVDRSGIWNHQRTDMCIEFRYNQRYEFEGVSYFDRSFQFDAVLLIVDSRSIMVVPYLGTDYYGLGWHDSYVGRTFYPYFLDDADAAKEFPSYKALQAFRQMVVDF